MVRKNKPVDVFKYIDMSGGPDACWPWKGSLNSEGRPYIQIDGKKHLAYRVAYELVKGESLGKLMFRHTCDNEICCNPNHGVKGTHEQNMDDMKRRERHGLPHHTVRAIKKLINEGRRDSEIAALYGISRTAVYEMRNSINYAHVKLEEDDENKLMEDIPED